MIKDKRNSLWLVRGEHPWFCFFNLVDALIYILMLIAFRRKTFPFIKHRGGLITWRVNPESKDIRIGTC